MEFFKSKCVDGSTLLVSPNLAGDQVIEALKEMANATITDQMDMLCASLAVDEDLWDELTTEEKRVFYAIVSNVFSVLVEDVDEYLDELRRDGYSLRFHDNMYIPSNVDLSDLHRTLLKIRH
jgi:hypothetical protein